MKYVMVYWSRYGHGKKIVNYLQKKLNEKKAETTMYTTDETDPANLPDADVYIFSAPTEAFRIQKNMRTFLKKLPRMPEKQYAIINTHGMKRNWLSSMEKMLSKKKMEKIAQLDFKMGKDLENVNGLPEGWQHQMDTFAEKIT